MGYGHPGVPRVAPEGEILKSGWVIIVRVAILELLQVAHRVQPGVKLLCNDL